MSLSHSVQKSDQQNASLNPIIQFLNTINAVPQKYGSFEKAEQAIRELVVELEKSEVTLEEKQNRAEEIAKILGDNIRWFSYGGSIGVNTLQSEMKY